MKISQDNVTARYPSLLLNLSKPVSPVMNLRIAARRNEIAADQIKGSGDSSYMIATGRQNRNVTVSRNRIVLKILKINNGLISFIKIFRRIQGYKYKQN